MQQISAYTLDGTNYLGQLTAHDFDIAISEVDGSGGAASDEIATEVQRATTYNFSLNVFNGSAAPMTSAQIATETVDGRDVKGVCKTFTVAVNNRTEDGAGHGDLDTYPVATKRKVTVNMAEVIDLATVTPELIEAANSATPADRQMVVSIIFGEGITLTMPMQLNKAQESESNGALTKVDASFSKRGAITSPVSGTTIYHVALIGDALVSLVWTKTIGATDRTYSAVGVISSLTITVEHGQITKAQGTLAIQGPATIAEV